MNNTAPIPESKVAQFKVNDVFKLTNRGVVLLGDVLTGEIKAGNFIHLSLQDNTICIYKISAIEIADFLNANKTAVGLIIDASIETIQTFDTSKHCIITYN